MKPNLVRICPFLIALLGTPLELHAEKETLFRFETAKYHIEYVVESDQLFSSSNAWDSSRQFPADLQTLALKAAEHLKQTRDLGEAITLSKINMHSKTSAKAKETKDETFGRERWFIAFGFDSLTKDGRYVPAHELTVVMLLDGTVAQERLMRGIPTYPYRTANEKSR